MGGLIVLGFLSVGNLPGSEPRGILGIGNGFPFGIFFLRAAMLCALHSAALLPSRSIEWDARNQFSSSVFRIDREAIANLSNYAVHHRLRAVPLDEHPSPLKLDALPSLDHFLRPLRSTAGEPPATVARFDFEPPAFVRAFFPAGARSIGKLGIGPLPALPPGCPPKLGLSTAPIFAPFSLCPRSAASVRGLRFAILPAISRPGPSRR